MESALDWLLATLALPKVGLPAVFIISLVSATLLPLGSEPAVFGYAKLNPEMFWPVVLVATAGNTIGGMIDWWLGFGARIALLRARTHGERRAARARFRNPRAIMLGAWFRRLGPPVLLLAWLPVIGDPLCAVAGWHRLPLGRCTVYMAIGKCVRYVVMTAGLLWVWP